MTFYEVNGARKLCGEIEVQGAKNSVLPILAATLLVKDKCIIHNCPNLSDVEAALKILVMLGCVCVRDSTTVVVDASDAANYEIPENLMREMRSSVLFLGAVVSRMGKAHITAPGGCELGPRPIDLHLSSLKKLGVTVNAHDNVIECIADKGIIPTVIDLPFPSVGTTENIIITAAISKGTTVIKGAAKEPEISDLADFLNAAGANIKGAGSSTVVINGVRSLHSCEHRIIPDRIVAATYLCAAAITNGKVCVKNVRPDYFMSIIKFFENLGCTVIGKNSSVTIKGKGTFERNINISTGVYPLFPTDAGPLAVSLLSVSCKTSTLTENIFQNRFRFIEQLNKFNADISIKNNTAYINGVRNLSPANVYCTDLRGGAALVLAALNAKGVSQISKVHHIERGYYNLCGSLHSLEADIKEVQNDGKKEENQ